MLFDFYKRILESVGFYVTKDGYIFLGNEEEKESYTVNGLPFVVPTEEHIKVLFGLDESTGKVTNTRYLFNPLNETILKGDSISLSRLKLVIERRLALAINVAGRLLLLVANNKELQSKLPTKINKFLSEIMSAKNANIKELVDADVIKNWDTIFFKSLKVDKHLISIFLKKSGVYENVKYNRLAVVSSPLLDILETATPDTQVFGMKLRNKEIKIYRIILKYLLNVDKNNTINFGSNDGETPGFISLFTAYVNIYKNIEDVILKLQNVDKSEAVKGLYNITVDLKELENLAQYKSEVLTIPNETVPQSKINHANTQLVNEVKTTSNAIPDVTAVQNNTSTEDPMDKFLKASGFQPNPFANFQQPAINPNLGMMNPVNPMMNNMGMMQPNMMGIGMMNPMMGFQQPMITGFPKF
ncbi:hypothetical protein ACVWU4_000955 [Campylobacter coli]